MLLFLIIFDLFIKINCLKIWKYDSDIMNKNNWQSINNNCEQIKFALINDAPIFIDKLLITKELILPLIGEINLINDGMILFKKNSKCIELKSFNYHYWSDYRNWQHINDNDDDDDDAEEDNEAIPDLERIPCDYDNISLPSGIHTRIKFDEYFNSIKLNSIKFKQQQLTNNDLKQLSTIKSKIFYSYYENFMIRIGEKPQDSTIDVCHQNFIPCPNDDDDNNNNNNDNIKCKNPIQPQLFCRKICGASIEFYKKSNFQLETIKNLLTKTQSTISTHLSHINDDLYQIIFTENDFTGISLIEAEEFYQNLKIHAHHYKINNLNLYKSGDYYLSGSGTTLILIFTTFFGVILIFAIIFYSFNQNNSLITRLRLGAINPGPFLARFDGQHLTLDGQSLSGSIVQLDQSFDNPMYKDDNDNDDDDDDNVEEIH